MDGTKITRQREGRMESYMVGTKITHQMDGWHKNNSPKRWTDGELYGQHESNMPNGWMDGTKIIIQRNGQMESHMVSTKKYSPNGRMAQK